MTSKSRSDLLDGKVALITGAARGQGRSHATTLARHGASILALDICKPVGSVTYASSTPEELRETVHLVEELGRPAIAAEIDVRDLDSLAEFVRTGSTTLGSLDIVIANAGINMWSGLLDTSADDPWHDTIGVNLTGVYNTLKASAPIMVEAGNGGSIIITSSATGLKAMPGMIAYAASKYGVTGLAKAAALELGPHDIRVNSIHPWVVNTPMGAMPPKGEETLAANPSFVDSFKQVLHSPEVCRT